MKGKTPFLHNFVCFQMMAKSLTHEWEIARETLITRLDHVDFDDQLISNFHSCESYAISWDILLRILVFDINQKCPVHVSARKFTLFLHCSSNSINVVNISANLCIGHVQEPALWQWASHCSLPCNHDVPKWEHHGCYPRSHGGRTVWARYSQAKTFLVVIGSWWWLEQASRNSETIFRTHLVEVKLIRSPLAVIIIIIIII